MNEVDKALHDKLVNPLTDKHLEIIQSKLDLLTGLDYAIQKAEQAGIDVSQSKAGAAAARKQLTSIKQVYFPNRS